MGIFSRKKNKNTGKPSYSQCGEDIIAAFVLRDVLNIRFPIYLDIGAHHPTGLNNTYHLYEQGARGVLIEPDPTLAEKIRKRRPNDTLVQAGVGREAGEADFFVMSARTLNTFSKEQADLYVSKGYKVEAVMKLPVVTVNQVMEKHLDGRTPDFVSLDVEGLDLVILQSFDFERWRPPVWCIETLAFGVGKQERKLNDIIEFMLSHGYRVHADTHINTIFVDRQAYEGRSV